MRNRLKQNKPDLPHYQFSYSSFIIRTTNVHIDTNSAPTFSLAMCYYPWRVPPLLKNAFIPGFRSQARTPMHLLASCWIKQALLHHATTYSSASDKSACFFPCVLARKVRGIQRALVFHGRKSRFSKDNLNVPNLQSPVSKQLVYGC